MGKKRRTRMFLSEIGNRRSRTARVATSAALAATFFGSMRIGWATTGTTRVTPPAPTRAAAGAARRVRPVSLEDVSGKVPSDALWKLFDGDAATGLDGQGDVRIQMTFSEPVAVTTVGGFGARDGRLVLHGASGATGGESAAAAGAAWTRVDAKSADPARTFVVEWAPGGASAALSELEVWGRFEGEGGAPARPLADALFDPVSAPAGSEVFTAPAETRVISVATAPEKHSFTVMVPRDPRSIERAFLTYELDGLSSYTGAIRRLNGSAPVGGFAAALGAKGGQQVEEISPAALRTGTNVVEFLPVSSKDPGGYRVGNVKLIVTHVGDSEAREAGDDIAVANELGDWQQPNGSIRHLRFAAPHQLHELRLQVTERQSGKLVVAAASASNRQSKTVDLGALGAGSHVVPLDGFPVVDEVTLGFEGAGGKALYFADLAVTGSPIPSAAAGGLRVTYPLHGECVNHQVHVRALTASRPTALHAGGATISASTWEPGAFSFTASEKALGGGHGQPFSFTLEATVAGQPLSATVPISGCVDRPLEVAGPDGPVHPREDVGAPYGAVVKAKRATKLAFAGLELDVPAGAVEKDVRVTVRPLSPEEVPAMDEGMINVTAGARAFRLGPHGMLFKKPVALSIPIDASRVTAGETARAFYFDEATRKWSQVPVVGACSTQVAASTTHFTDFIASTLAVPEHPGLQSLDPTSLKNIKVADPSAEVTQIAPPTANTDGTATLSYPIEVPPGRLGMQPHLAITYDSSRGNGWLGTGWDLSISSIEIDTRWGVPRYNTAFTEQYMIDGEALTPLSAAPAGAPAGGTYYARRREGKFDWIQRVTAANGSYSWLVTDKAGTKYTYGLADNARLAPQSGTSANELETYKWFLQTAEDINGNQVNYTYNVVTGNNGDSWVQLYPASIAYTASSVGGPSAPYSVVFNLQSGTRADAFSTGRPGFQVLTNQLLGSIDVKDGTTIVRHYSLTYTAGDFGKTLLQKISELGKGGTGNSLGDNVFTYNTTPVGSTGTPQIFGSPTSQGTPYTTLSDPNDYVTSPGDPVDYHGFADQQNTTDSQQATIFVAGGGQTHTWTKGVAGFEDMNGDGLPDYLPFSNTGSSNGLTEAISVSGPNVVGTVMNQQSFPGLTTPYSEEDADYMTSSYNFIVASGSQDYGDIMQGRTLHTDVNGDGLLDIVTGAQNGQLQVQLNQGQFKGFAPAITMPGYQATGLGFDCSDIWTDNGDTPPTVPPTGNQVPTADVITRWVAPYTGQVQINGQITRQGANYGNDPLLASLYIVNSASAPTGTMIWQHTVNPNDGPCTPVDGGLGILGTVCSTSSTTGFFRTVNKGDRIYTRVGAVSHSNQDGLLWNTTITYTTTSSPASEANTREAWGPFRYKWSEQSDEEMAGAYYKPWTAAFAGSVQLQMQVDKGNTADNVAVLAWLYRPSSGEATFIGSAHYNATTIVDPNSTGPLTLQTMNVNPDDQIHVFVQSDTPIDPGTIKVLTVANYMTLCRPNPYGGGTYCGTPVCTAHTDDGGSDCVLNGPAGTTDPQVGSPLSGSQVSQIVPTYNPLQRWVYQATTTPNPPTTSLDGRTGVFTNGTQQPQICYQNPSPQNTSSQTVTVMVQTTPGQLLTKYVQPLNVTGDVNLCTPLPAQGNNTQVVFSVYYDPNAYSGAPLPSWVQGTFTANLISSNGTKTPVPVEFYVRDTTYPQLTTFPFFGGVENMASGYHNFNMGLWNGNASFDESFIAGQTTTANYAPMIQAPMPVPSSTGGGSGTNSFLGLGSIVSFLEDVVGAIASFAKYVWDDVSKVLSIVGSMLIQAVRWIGSFLGDLITWAMCEIEGVGYTADGIRLTENHNKQEGAGNGIGGVGRNHGFSLSGLDLVDMNGDRYPDQVSTQGIRYAYFDPTTNTGQFCTTPSTSATCATSGKPQVSFPSSYIRDVRHAMHSYNFGVNLTAIADAVVTMASGTETNGVEPGVAESTDASQGYSRTNRDLIDINGDGLPDVVDVGSIACSPQATRADLCVQLNYGYGFSAPIWWKSSAWSRDAGSLASTVPTLLNSELAQDLGSLVQQELNVVGDSLNTYDPPTSQTIRLEEEGHKGGQVSIGPFGGGSDDSYTRKLVDLVDVNGDGLPDQIMKLPGDSYRIKLNTGSGFGAEIASDAIAWPAANVWFSDSAVSVASTDTLEFTRNYTSDDSNDYGFYGDSSGNGSRQTLIELMDIDGDGRLDQVMKNVLFTGPNDPSATQVWARLNQVGASNLLSGVTLPLGGNFQISYSRTGNVVGTQQFPWGESVNVDMQDARWTMSECLTNDGRGNQIETLFEYSLGYFDRTEREFFGFAQVETDHGSRGMGGGINGDGSYEMQFFRNQNYYERGLPYADYTVEVFGAVERGTVYNYILGPTPNATGSEYVQTESRVDQPFDKTQLFFNINPTLVFAQSFPLSGSPVSKYTVHNFDTNGNLGRFWDFGDLQSSDDDVFYELQYETFPGTHLTGLIHIDERSTLLQTLLAQREATYTVTNNRPQVTQIRDLVIGGSQPVSGSPYTGTNTQVQTYNLTYNTADLGNVGTLTDPTGYKLTYSYDAATKTHVTGVSDSFSLTSSRAINQDYGLPATTTDVNGKVVTYNYDSFGRLSKVWSPVDPTTGQATIQMTYSQGGAAAATPWALTKHKDFQSTTGTTIDTVAFADGLGRIIQTKKKADFLQSNGTTAHGYDITGLIVWDANGRVMAQSQPFFDSATAETTLVPAVSKNPTVFTYDGLNRVTSATTADGAMTETAYGALLTSHQDSGDPLPNYNGQLSLERSTDANENTTRVYRDGAGRIVFNMDAENNVTAYGYDLLNNLSTVTDANGNVTTGTYDSLSRLVSLSSPDTGETDWRYALSGLLQEKQTANLRAKSQLIKFGYTTNRLTTITYPTLPVVTYTYGTSAQTGSSFGNIAGRIASVTMEGGTESRQYDAFGNVSQTTTTLHHINNTTLTSPVVTMKYAYDWLGRMETMTFPHVVDNNWNIATGDGEVITYAYDAGGRVKQITGKATPTSTAETYLSSIGYDEFGTRANLVSGNGITTAYTYDPAQHRLSTVTASGKSASGATVQFLNVAYGYDPVGNVLTVNDNVANSAIQPNSAVVGIGPSQITNTYDADNRLSSSSGMYRGHSTSGQAYSMMFLYNGIDNITSKSQVDSPLTFAAGASGLSNPTYGTALTGTSYTLHYSYTPGKAHQPGTIFDINSVGAQSTRTENFDANGNNLGDAINSTTRILTWDETDRLKSVTQNGGVVARYQYTPDGVRTQKQDAVAATTSFYFNQFLVINGSKQMTKSLFAGDMRVASKTESAQLTTPVRSFYHADNIGSTSYISNSAQTLVQHEKYFPTGELWSSPEETVTVNNIQRDYLFTGKELDRNTGFYYFGARYLDPRTSNWLSADPLLSTYMRGVPNLGAFAPENLSLYAYSWNNPMVARDPTGLSPCRGQCTMKPIVVEGDPHAKLPAPPAASRPINQGPRTTNLTGFSLNVHVTDTHKVFPGVLGAAAFGGLLLTAGPAVVGAAETFAAGHPALVQAGTAITLGEAGVVAPGGVAGRVLNIGSGNRPLSGAINLDIVIGKGVDILADARALPFGNGTIGRVVADRLPSLLGGDPQVAAEIYRVLMPGGTARLTCLSGFGATAVQTFQKAGFSIVQAAGGILNLVK